MPTMTLKNLKLSPADRSISKCEKCVNAMDPACRKKTPSTCNDFCAPLGHYGSIMFDDEVSRYRPRKY